MKVVLDSDFEDIENEEYLKIISEYEKIIKKCIKLCLENEGVDCKEIEIYLRYTTNRKIRWINRKYRGIDRSTDVLSFPMYEKKEIKYLSNEKNVVHLGDIIISIQKVEAQAQEYGHGFRRELLYLITHAMHHLMGYDHIEEKDKKQMRIREEKVMEQLKTIR